LGERIPVGLLFSRSGSYAVLGSAMYSGAMLAIEEVNAEGQGFQFVPVPVNPGGRLVEYFDGARSLLVDGVSHVIGCYTSSSRKEVLPLFEKHDALLWYPSHYEGFETSDNVIYTGAAPNQHIVPLTRFLLATRRRRGWLLGSNYVWAWENNRIMREALLAAGGAVLGERYFPVGDIDLQSVVGQILDAPPDFVFSTLIGASAYAFFQLLRAQAERRGIDQPQVCPVASCSLSEPELACIGPDAADGHISSSVYFSTIETPENARFLAAWHARFPDLGPTSADAEASYNAVHLLARAIGKAGGPGYEAVRSALASVRLAAPQGEVRIDQENRHAHLRPRIGLSRADGRFEIVAEYPGPVRPDPYLVWEPVRARTDASAPTPADLRLVS
jgi:ABC-type branched-subunit amino acid transport system substrate-binding protein